MDRKESIESLFRRYLDDRCTLAEIKQLLQYFNAGENEQLLRTLIQKESEKIEDVVDEEDHFTLLNATFSKIKNAIAVEQQTSRIPLYKKLWFRASAAAVLMFLIAAPAFFLLRVKKENQVVAKEKFATAKDLPPGRNNAVLTLANGTRIVLDSASNGALAQQGNIKVFKLNGEIAYQSAGEMKNGKPVYNTITTGKGNEYQLILSDGSKVWLNAASSIHFPAYFSGNERKVAITGEAYFEVVHDRSRPFKVEFSNATGEKGQVEVLGTHFDINAYPDEKDIKTTLLEGSVKISKSNKIQMLSPGEQAIIRSDEITLKKDVDVAQITAWKDGYFLFNNTDIQTIMRQVARWYDVDVNFEGKIPSDGFTGKISRNVPLSKILKVLELNDVSTRTEGRTVTIIF